MLCQHITRDLGLETYGINSKKYFEKQLKNEQV